MTTVMIVHSTCGSSMYIYDCMTSQCSFYYNQLFETNRRVQFGICIHGYSHNIPFYHIAIL